jgi:hypothetical protein
MNQLTMKICGNYTLAVVFGSVMLMLILPALAVGQSSRTQTPRIGILAWSSCESSLFLRGLLDLGYKPGDPLENISNLRDVQFIMKGGVLQGLSEL